MIEHWSGWDGLGDFHDTLVVLWHKDVLNLLPAFTWHSNRVFRDLTGTSSMGSSVRPERRCCGAVLTIAEIVWPWCRMTEPARRRTAVASETNSSRVGHEGCPPTTFTHGVTDEHCSSSWRKKQLLCRRHGHQAPWRHSGGELASHASIAARAPDNEGNTNLSEPGKEGCTVCVVV